MPPGSASLPGAGSLPGTASFPGAAAPQGVSKAEAKAAAKRSKAEAKAKTQAAAKQPKPAAPKGQKAAPKSRLVPLLAVLGVVLVCAGAYYFIGGDSTDETSGEVEVAGTTVERAETTVAPSAVAETTLPAAAVEPAVEPAVAPETTIAPAAVEPETPTTLGADVAAQYNAAFATEATRACDAIKADPGLLTESVIQYNELWSAAGMSYEQLQTNVNVCTKAAREEAFAKVEAAEK